MSLLKILSSKIKFLRKKRGLTQEQLAELVGMEPNSISFIETGKSFLTVKNTEKMAAALKVHPFEFYIPQDLSSEENENLRKLIINRLESFDTIDLRFFIHFLEMYADVNYEKFPLN